MTQVMGAGIGAVAIVSVVVVEIVVVVGVDTEIAQNTAFPRFLTLHPIAQYAVAYIFLVHQNASVAPQQHPTFYAQYFVLVFVYSQNHHRLYSYSFNVCSAIDCQ